ncbi:MAG: hypothetical protein KF729_32275 [Sandaracinaceae bacterium]|nr:hypothetical protein [Sandaracinaceae bacterium]
MRTTIELTDAQRAKLLDLAAQRGLKGFSPLIREAVDKYLEEQAGRLERVRAAQGVLGTFDDDAGERLAESMRRARSDWR